MQSATLAALAGAIVLAAGCASPAPRGEASSPTPPVSAAMGAPIPALSHPSGVYRLDPSHASVVWRVEHLGFSRYTARFSQIDAELTLNAEAPQASALSVSIAAASVDTGHRDPDGAASFDATIARQALGGADHPVISFVSRRIESADGVTGVVHGDLTLNGVTRPVSLDVTFNGGRFVLLTQKYTLGFSARTQINRSDFGSTAWAGPVGDQVEIWIEAEFQKT